jgi:hypothetical protein
MKKYNWVKAWLPPCITFGIYNIVMWAVMTKNSNKIALASGQKKIMAYIPAMLLGCVTFGIVPLVWMIKFQAQQVAIAKANGAKISPVRVPFVLFLLMSVPIYSYIVLCGNYNRNVDAFEAKAAEATAE